MFVRFLHRACTVQQRPCLACVICMACGHRYHLRPVALNETLPWPCSVRFWRRHARWRVRLWRRHSFWGASRAKRFRCFKRWLVRPACKWRPLWRAAAGEQCVNVRWRRFVVRPKHRLRCGALCAAVTSSAHSLQSAVHSICRILRCARDPRSVYQACRNSTDSC